MCSVPGNLSRDLACTRSGLTLKNATMPRGGSIHTVCPKKNGAMFLEKTPQTVRTRQSYVKNAKTHFDMLFFKKK